MFARAATGTLEGVVAHEVVVEASRGRGLPGLSLVGLARGAVRESLVRVRGAVMASCDGQVDLGVSHKVVINLLPAELPKTGSAMDLALAVAWLSVCGMLPPESLEGRRFFGELSLGGELQAARGTVLMADLARRAGDRELLIPEANADEAAIVPGIQSVGVRNLRTLIEHLRGERELPVRAPSQVPESGRTEGECWSQVRGQTRAKRALEIAAAGGHNALLVGPPGCGKTMLARRLVGILPPLSVDQSVEVTRVHSVAGCLRAGGLVTRRPFRGPHHSLSEAALCGGGNPLRPGEISLAHHGVLFLDELPEFNRRALESLREPLEAGSVHVARAHGSQILPARTLLVAAMNPCPCGYFVPGESVGRCTCSLQQIQRYQGKISGPVLDRLDLHVRVERTPYQDLISNHPQATTEEIAMRVLKARRRQEERLGEGRCNAMMLPEESRTWIHLSPQRRVYLAQAMEARGFSARASESCLRVALTIADLEGRAQVRPEHIQEAMGLREMGQPFGGTGQGLGSAPQESPPGVEDSLPSGSAPNPEAA